MALHAGMGDELGQVAQALRVAEANLGVAAPCRPPGTVLHEHGARGRRARGRAGSRAQPGQQVGVGRGEDDVELLQQPRRETGFAHRGGTIGLLQHPGQRQVEHHAEVGQVGAGQRVEPVPQRLRRGGRVALRREDERPDPRRLGRGRRHPEAGHAGVELGRRGRRPRRAGPARARPPR